MPQDKGQCLWKDHCPLLEANSILIEILMLEKSAISLPPRTPRILCALRGGHQSIRGKREKGTHGDSPCNPVRWDVFLHQQKSLHKVCCYKSESWSSYWGLQGTMPSGPGVLTFRGNNTGSFSQPPLHVHTGDLPPPVVQPHHLHPPQVWLNSRDWWRRAHKPHDRLPRPKIIELPGCLQWWTQVIETGWIVCFYCISGCGSSF